MLSIQSSPVGDERAVATAQPSYAWSESNVAMSEEADFVAPSVILTCLETLHIGLRLVNFTHSRVNRIAEDSKTDAVHFAKRHGCDHFVAAQVFEDLQMTDIDNARLDENKISTKHFLITLHFLKVCEIEGRHEPTFDRSPKTM